MSVLVTCYSDSCSKHIVPEDALYNDRLYHYYCDETCFHDWADDNIDEVINYYKRLNVSS